MTQGPESQQQLGELIDANREEIEHAILVGELERAADVPRTSLDQVVSEDAGSVPEVTPLSETGRTIVDGWLAGIDAARKGLFNVFFIEISDGGIMVTPENADEIEETVRTHFAPYYPEIAPAVPEV